MFFKPGSATALTAFILLYISITSFQIVKAAPRPTPIALFDPQLKARHHGHNETPTATPGFRKQNGLDAQKLNSMFKTLKSTDACEDGQMACIDSQFAQCVSSQWDLTSCASGTSCFALPLVNKPGTSLVCDVPSDANARFEATGVQGGPDGSGSGTGGNGADDCDDDPETPPNGSPKDDGDCDDNIPSSSAASRTQPTSPGDSIVFTTVTTTLTLPSPTQSNANNVYTVRRRQLLTALSSSLSTPSPSPSPSEIQPSPSSLTPSSNPLSQPSPSLLTPSSSSFPLSQPNPSLLTPSSSSSLLSQPSPSLLTPSSSSSLLSQPSPPLLTPSPSPLSQSGASSPPIQNGIVTVTVVSVSVSTVTVTTNAPSPPPPSLSTGSPVAGFIPTNSPNASPAPSTIVSSFSFTPSSMQTPGSSVQSSVPPAQSSATSPPVITLQAADPTTTPGGFSFSTQGVPTPAPDPSPTQDVNISELLTATVPNA